MLRLVEVLLTSDSRSTCQVLNCLEFTCFLQFECLDPKLYFSGETTMSLGYDMANIPLHNIFLAASFFCQVIFDLLPSLTP